VSSAISRTEATVFLFFYSLSSTIGYIVFALFLLRVPFFMIVWWMFVCELIYLAYKYDYLWHFRIVLSETWRHALWVSFSTLVYWYAFWYGITAYPGQTSIALAFLSLMTFATPLAIYFSKLGRPSLSARFWSAGGLVVVGVFLMQTGKANPLGSMKSLLQSTFWLEVNKSLHWDTVICFALVVAAQASNYLCRLHFTKTKPSASERIKAAGLSVFENREGSRVEVLNWDAPFSISFALCTLFGFAVVVLGAVISLNSRTLFEWSDAWIVVMAICGLLIPSAMQNHLILNRRMASHHTEPWMAVRPLIFLAVAALIEFVLKYTQLTCPNEQSLPCALRLFSNLTIAIYPRLIPPLNDIFWTGAVLGGLGFLVLMWPNWQTEDGFVDKGMAS
jgi:hypothetical protein